jgi:hypothetical protein
MRKFVTIASVVVLAAGSATCVNSHPGVNSGSNLLPMATVVSPSALEARSGGGNGRGNAGAGSSLTLVMVDDARVIGPSWGDIVRFDVSTTATRAFISLECYQGSAWVLAAGGWPLDSEFTLAAASWPGGAADCTATLFTTTDGRRTTTLATLAFHVSDGSVATPMARGGNGGGSGGTSSLTLVMVDDANRNGVPNYGDKLTFNLSTTVTSPFVSLNCYQGVSWIYAASVGYFDSYPWAKEFTLAGTSWPGGPADCTATLYTTKDGRRTTTLATLSFHVEA